MKHKKELVVLSLIAITIIGILSGASYAYFQVPLLKLDIQQAQYLLMGQIHQNNILQHHQI